MKLSKALNAIHAPKGLTSVIEAVMHRDFDPVREQSAVDLSLIEAQQKLEDAEKAQRDCTSDWAYWGYQGDVSYWKAVVDILTAANLMEGEDLPDVPAPKLGGVVMDDCSKVQKYGRNILTAAKTYKGLTT